MIDKWLTNWKTTSLGLTSLLGAVGIFIFLPFTQENFLAGGTAVILGLGLLFARDADKTSEGTKIP